MTQPEGVAAAIGSAPVEPAATNQTAPESLPVTDVATLQAKVAAFEEQFNTLKSSKDKETAAERRAKQEAERRLAEAEAALAAKEAEIARATDQHWQTFAKYAPEDEVKKAQEAYMADQAQRQQAVTQRAQWEAWKWKTLSAEGVPPAEIDGAKSQTAVNALLQKYREEKLVASKTAEIEQAIIEKLKKEGVIMSAQPAPKTPVDVKSEPTAPKKKPSADEVEKLREAYALHPRNKAAKEAYEKATTEFAARG